MATEFQRASQALEKLQESLAQLGVFNEVDDWVLLATTSAAERVISDQERTAFVDAEEKLQDLEELTLKMRKKCQAHEELQRLQSELLHDASLGEVLVSRVAELQGTATYGRNMLEKVMELIQRFDAAKERFKAEVVPRFAAAVAAQEAEEALRKERMHQEAELEEWRLRAEEQRPLAELLANSEKRLQELQLAQEDAEEWLRVPEISLSDLCYGSGSEVISTRTTKSIYS